MGATSENGPLRSVAVLSPKHFQTTDPINEKQSVEYSLGMIDRAQLLIEHDALVGALRASDVHVVEIEPHPNQPYALNVRDAAIVIGDQIVAGAMGKEMRQSEPSWLLRQLGCTLEAKFIDRGHLEGGDVFVLNRACLVGISERTDQVGIERLAAVVDRRIVPVPLRTGVLHLDTAMNLIGDKLVVAPDLLQDYATLKANLRTEDISTVIEVSAHDAWNLETNFCMVTPGRAIVAASSVVGRRILESNGVEVIGIPMAQHHRIGGSVRCATLPLVREQ